MDVYLKHSNYCIADNKQYEIKFNGGICVGGRCLDNGVELSYDDVIELGNHCKEVYFAYNGFYKVDANGYSITKAIFFNPITKETFSKIIWDNDDPRVELENKQLYHMRVCDYAHKLYLRHLGQIQVGDQVEIYKGRKMVGETKKVVKFREWSKGHIGVTYAIFEDGTSVNVDNCKLI